jgi:hypothetical protein
MSGKALEMGIPLFIRLREGNREGRFLDWGL